MKHEFVTLEGSDPMEAVEYARVGESGGGASSDAPVISGHRVSDAAAAKPAKALQYAVLKGLAVDMSSPSGLA
jgi:hypothetical protein